MSRPISKNALQLTLPGLDLAQKTSCYSAQYGVKCSRDTEAKKAGRRGPPSPTPLCRSVLSHTAEYLHHIYYKQSPVFLQGPKWILRVASGGVGSSSLRRFCCLSGEAHGAGLGSALWGCRWENIFRRMHYEKIHLSTAFSRTDGADCLWRQRRQPCPGTPGRGPLT